MGYRWYACFHIPEMYIHNNKLPFTRFLKSELAIMNHYLPSTDDREEKTLLDLYVYSVQCTRIDLNKKGEI